MHARVLASRIAWNLNLAGRHRAIRSNRLSSVDGWPSCSSQMHGCCVLSDLIVCLSLIETRLQRNLRKKQKSFSLRCLTCHLLSIPFRWNLLPSSLCASLCPPSWPVLRCRRWAPPSCSKTRSSAHHSSNSSKYNRCSHRCQPNHRPLLPSTEWHSPSNWPHSRERHSRSDAALRQTLVEGGDPCALSTSSRCNANAMLTLS